MASSSRRGRRGRGFLAALLGTGLALAGVARPAGAQSAGDLPTNVGRVALVDGQASFREATQDPWTAGLANTPVTAGSSLWTQPASRAALDIAAGRFWLDGATEIDITRFDDSTVMLGLPQGRLDVSLGGLRPGDSYVVVTPAGSVALEAAGFYRITAGDQNTAPSVAVFAGRADFSSAGGTQTVEGGQEAFAAGAPAQFGAAEEDNFDRWVDSEVGQDTGQVSSQYVAPGIPGTDDLDAYGQWRDVPDYGTVWVPTQVPADWEPYRDGRWQWIDPWGWTWVDNAPWGFAPFHYGRWINLNGWWSWVPGRRDVRPLYAPALVSFVGDPGGITDGGGPCVGWIPLGPDEIYRPGWVGIDGGLGLAVTFDLFRRMNPDIRADRLARFDDHGRFRDRDDGHDQGDRFVNRNYVTLVNRDTFVNAQPVQAGLRRVQAGAAIHGAFSPAQAGLPTAPSGSSRGDRLGVVAPPRPRQSFGGGVFPGGGVGNVGRPPAPVQVFRGGLGSVSPVPSGVSAGVPGGQIPRPSVGAVGSVGAPPAPIRPLVLQGGGSPQQSYENGQLPRQNFGAVGSVGAPPAPIRPFAPLGVTAQPIRPLAPVAPLRPIVIQPSYQQRQYQQQYQPQIRQPQFQQAAPAFHPSAPRPAPAQGQQGTQRRPQ